MVIMLPMSCVYAGTVHILRYLILLKAKESQVLYVVVLGVCLCPFMYCNVSLHQVGYVGIQD